MELWIISQDKTTFSKVSIIQLCENPDRSWFFNTDEGLIIGKYKTKERALKVLKEIRNLIDDISDGKMVGCTYEMPNE